MPDQDNNTVLYHSKAAGFTLYPNRVEFQVGGIGKPQTDILFLKHVVEIKSMGVIGQLTLLDEGGREHKYGIGGGEAQKVLDILVTLL